MKAAALLLTALVISSCAHSPKLVAPVGLSDAILTLPAPAVSNMSKQGRITYLTSKSGEYNAQTRRLHLFSDSTAAGDGDSMLFLRLFEDAEGRTIAACHSARPFADGRAPSNSDTLVFRLEGKTWVDITNSAFSSDVPRNWWFRFSEEGDEVPCGPYVEISRRDGRGKAMNFGKPRGTLVWRHGSFHYKQKAS